MKDSPTKDFYDRIWSAQSAISEDKEIQMMRSAAVDYSYSLAEPLQGKKLLEIGCGAGFQTGEFARRGATVTAIDFSEASIKNTKLLIEKQNKNAEVRRMNAETLDFPKSSFDIVYINSVLMHTDKKKVLQECARVLKKKGKAIIVEPLDHNPFLVPYRFFFSPYQETKPKYMTIALFKRYANLFSRMKHREFYFFYVLALPLHRWKNLLKIIARADKAILKMLPFLRTFCWVSVVEYEK